MTTVPTDLDFDMLMLVGVPAGQAVQVRVLQPGYEQSGLTYPGDHQWHDVPVITDAKRCEHADTICVDCVDAWACDHDLRLAAAGTN